MQPGRPFKTKHQWGDATNPYEEIGGAENLLRLVNRFYDIIEAESPDLRAMLPADTSVSREKLFEFLSGWMGGPPLYYQKRGHPKLRMRHFPFSIGSAEAVEWMRCMTKAMEEEGIAQQLRSFLEAQFTSTALHLRNREEP